MSLTLEEIINIHIGFDALDTKITVNTRDFACVGFVQTLE